MKIAGKRIAKGNILLYLSFTAISLCFLLMTSTMRTEKINSMSQRTLYSRHYKNFSIYDSKEYCEWNMVIPELSREKDDFTIYLPMKENSVIMRGVFVKGNFVNPPMLWGEYFDLSSSWTDEPKLVLGKEYQDNIFEKEGKKYYKYKDTDFEVIGVMGTKEESNINKMIMIDFKSALSFEGINVQYVLDTKRKSNLENIAERLNELFPFPATIAIGIQEENDTSFVKKLLSADVIMDTLYMMIIICFSLSIVIVTFIWLSSRKQLFYALTLYGYERRIKLLEIAKRFYFASGSSFVTGIALILIISNMSSDINVITSDLIQAFLMTIGMGSVIFFFCYFMSIRKVYK